MLNTRLVRTLLSSVATALALSTAALPCHANLAPFHPANERPSVIQLILKQKNGGITQGQAAQIAKKRFGGKVLSVTRKGGDTPVYKVKLLLKDGRVKIVTVDAKTGGAR